MLVTTQCLYCSVNLEHALNICCCMQPSSKCPTQTNMKPCSSPGHWVANNAYITYTHTHMHCTHTHTHTCNSFVGAVVASLIRGLSHDLAIKAGLRAAYASLCSPYAVSEELNSSFLQEDSINGWANWEASPLQLP